MKPSKIKVGKKYWIRDDYGGATKATVISEGCVEDSPHREDSQLSENFICRQLGAFFIPIKTVVKNYDIIAEV